MRNEPTRRRRGRPPHPDILTPREWEVLALLRQRLTNEQIARRLDVSVATARYHVSEILSKLGAASREEAAAWQPEMARTWWQRVLAPLTLAKAALIAAALAAVGGGGLLAWGALSDGEPPDEVAATSPSPSSTAGTQVSGGPPRDIPPGDYPPGFIAFVEEMESGMLAGDAYFFTAVGENVHTGDTALFICSPRTFPAAGPNCVETTPNPITAQTTGILGIRLGALQSEGDILDQISYSSWIDDYLRNADPNSSDEFGGSSPRIYAIADADPVVQPERAGQQTYAIVTTRIAGPIPKDQLGDAVLSAPEHQRQVVVFFVTFENGGWLITSLLRTPIVALDPRAPGANSVLGDLFLTWRRWPTP